MTRHLPALALGSNPVVKAGKDERVIHFEETRFRSHALSFQESLRSVAENLAAELEVPLYTSERLSKETEQQLNTSCFCVFDFLSVKTTNRSGFLQAQWFPVAIFVDGSRVFSIQAAYDKQGAYLKNLTLVLNGKDETTPCTTADAAAQVGLGYIRTYLLKESTK